MECLAKNLWTFPIVLPNNPLKWLNCYVIKGENDGRNLIIDSGFNMPECREALLKGMEELQLLPEKTDVFFTHVHSDHIGNAHVLSDLGCRLFISATDKAVRDNDNLPYRRDRLLHEGMTEDTLAAVIDNNPGLKYASEKLIVTTLNDGEILSYGSYNLECVATPGHTPGHMCLYDEEHKLIFLGDHVLFDISPNINIWNSIPDSVGTYMNSLQKIMNYDVQTVLSAHRTTGKVSMQQRIQHLLEHHNRRLDEAVRIISEHPGINAYDLAGKMSWKIRARSWDSFPLAQKGFAVLETLAHLDHLVLKGRITSLSDDAGCKTYVVASDQE